MSHPESDQKNSEYRVMASIWEWSVTPDALPTSSQVPLLACRRKPRMQENSSGEMWEVTQLSFLFMFSKDFRQTGYVSSIIESRSLYTRRAGHAMEIPIPFGSRQQVTGAVHLVSWLPASHITHYRIQKSCGFIYKVVPVLEVLTVLINSFSSVC